MSEVKSADDDSPKAAKTPVGGSPSLTHILDAHAKMETQCGEIYVQFAGAFGANAELKQMWTAMALEEGGHAALVRAVSKGLVSGLLSAKPPVLPFEYVDSLGAQLREYQRRAQEGVPLDQALQITWELECSELDFMREMLVSASNLASLGFPTSDEARDKHVGRLRELIQKHASNEALRREVKFVSSELFRPGANGEDE
jgi:hypothetical protein